MLKSLHLLALAFYIFLCTPVSAQEPDAPSVEDLNKSFLRAYGPDQHLVSGLRYINMHMGYEGHKFFMEDLFVNGKLTMGKDIYPDVFLKYDIYDQQLILRVSDQDDYYDEIIVPGSRLEGFNLENRTFRKLHFPGTDTLIFQVIGDENPVCLYHWEKSIIRKSQDQTGFYRFSNMKRKSYVVTNSGMHRFNGARSFAKAFPDHRALIMKYIRREKIRISKAGDLEMRGLINYCNQLIIEVSNNEDIPSGIVSGN